MATLNLLRLRLRVAGGLAGVGLAFFAGDFLAFELAGACFGVDDFRGVSLGVVLGVDFGVVFVFALVLTSVAFDFALVEAERDLLVVVRDDAPSRCAVEPDLR